MPSIGETLRQERESRDIPLDEVARATRISEGYLAALESDDLQALPGTVFNKGYVRAYAHYLGLDPEPLVRAYLEEESAQTQGGQIAPNRDVLEGLRESVERGGAGRLRRGALVGAAFLVAASTVVVVGWLVLPRVWPGGDVTTTEASGTPEGPAERVAGVGVPEGAAGPAPVRGESPPAGAAGDEGGEVAGPASHGEPAASRAGEPASGSESLREPVPAPAVAPAGSESLREPVPTPAVAPSRATATRSPPEATAPRPTTTGAAAETGRLSVPEFGVGTAVVNRRLDGEADRFAEGAVVWFWTRVTGGQRGDQIRHVWIHEDRVVSSVTLSVGGSHWRTYSRRSLPSGSAGRWAVEARDPQGRILATRAFVCEPASPSAG